MKTTSLYGLVLMLLLASCAENKKKIFVVNHGRATVNVDAKTVKVKDGTGNEDHEMTYDTKEKVSINVDVDGKTFVADAAENGQYILNAKNDTLIGGVQTFGSKQDDNYFSQEMIEKRIDSFTNLISGKGIAADQFYITPFSVKKVADSANVVIILPFHDKTAIEPDENGRIPKVLRFYTVNEIRGKIKNLVEYTKPTGKKTEKK